jgi:negative regulator of sigma-B (phosphoserine phosphatase)
MERLSKSGIELGVAGVTLPGQSTCGDQYVYETFAGGVLLAVVDGIGHGPEAAAAAEAACAILKTHAADPVIALAERCHGSLRFTRGVVMSLAAFDLRHNLLTWLGIGNVHGVLRRFGLALDGTEELLLLRAGVVGSHLPPLRASVLPVVPGDTLVLATDGVQCGFAPRIALAEAPLRAAQAILDGYNKGTDDALVLVARYQGYRTNGNREIND